jgi:hypothetical protein
MDRHRSLPALFRWEGRQIHEGKDQAAIGAVSSSRLLPMKQPAHARKAPLHSGDATISTHAPAALGNRFRESHAIPESWLPGLPGCLRFR